jgi:hypothetical protein
MRRAQQAIRIFFVLPSYNKEIDRRFRGVAAKDECQNDEYVTGDEFRRKGLEVLNRICKEHGLLRKTNSFLVC